MRNPLNTQNINDIKLLAQNLIHAHLLFEAARKDFYSTINKIRFGRTKGLNVVFQTGLNNFDEVIIKTNNAARIVKKIENNQRITRLDILRFYAELIRLTDCISGAIEGLPNYKSSYFDKENTIPPVPIAYVRENTEEEVFYNVHLAGYNEAILQASSAMIQLEKSLYNVADKFKDIEEKKKFLKSVLAESPKSFTDSVYEYYFCHFLKK